MATASGLLLRSSGRPVDADTQPSQGDSGRIAFVGLPIIHTRDVVSDVSVYPVRLTAVDEYAFSVTPGVSRAARFWDNLTMLPIQ